MDQCPGLIGGINDPNTSCNIQSPVNEQIDGILTALPGNNPVTGWGTSGGSAPPSGSSSSSSAASSASSGLPGSSVYDGSSSSPSPSAPAIGSSTPAGPGDVQSTSTPPTGAAPGAPGYSAPGAGSSPSSSGPVAPVSTGPGSGSGFDPAGSACAVVTATITMTAWYTPGSSAAPSAVGSSTSPSAADPTDPTLPNWTYTGCYTDVYNARVLSGITFANLGAHNTTTTGCVAYCDAEGYSIAGTEYGGQCSCGNSLASASTKVGNDKCSMACEGDSTQLCGGGLTLSVYSKGTSAWKEKRGKQFGRRGLY